MTTTTRKKVKKKYLLNWMESVKRKLIDQRIKKIKFRNPKPAKA